MKTISHPYKFQLIPVGQIRVNTLYQRDTNNNVIKSIVSNFDYHLVNPIKVVWDHNEWIAIDGQHTAAALRTLFGNDYLAPCLVYEDVGSWFEQAVIFIKTNRREMHKVLAVIPEWKARLFSNETKAVEIKKVCDRYNLKIPTGKGTSGNGWVKAPAALERIYDNLTPEQFDQVLYILTCAWHGKKDSLLAPMLNGLAMFVKTYWSEYNRAALIKRLGNVEPIVIIRAGKASTASGHAKYAREILNVYNKGTTSGRLVDKLG